MHALQQWIILQNIFKTGTFKHSMSQLWMGSLCPSILNHPLFQWTTIRPPSQRNRMQRSSHIKVLNFSIQNITGAAIHHLPSFPLPTDWNRIKCSKAPYALWDPVWQETATMLIDIPTERTVCHPPVHIHYYHKHFEINWSTISATTI